MTEVRDILQAVEYGRMGTGHPFQRMMAAGCGFDAAIDKIRAALHEADLWIIHEIDPQMLLQRGGYAIRRARQILFFHPRYMARLLAADPSALPEAPLKVVVMEEPDAVQVRWFDPVSLLARYGNQQLEELGHEFTGVYATITERMMTR